jgi:transposase-like protein
MRVYPQTGHQRCWNHRTLNILDKLPRRLHATTRIAIHALYEGPSRAECSWLRADYCIPLRAQEHRDAAACLERDWEDFVPFYDYPEEHWTQLRTSNPIESIFAGVRLRTNAARRMQVRENALYLVFKLVLRLGTNWRLINGRNQLGLLLAGERFINSRLERTQRATGEGTAA